MSHFAMIVTGDDLDAHMAPFDENAPGPDEDGKWDWWCVGGRWSDRLLHVDGHWCDSLLRSELDMDGMLEAHRERCVKRYEEIQADPGQDFFGDAKGLTLKEYLHRYEIPATWGILHKGTWYAKGAMGWFAATDAREEDNREWAEGWWKFIQNLRPDTRLTMVDCHV